MKLNIYSSSLFIIIFIVLYPFIFYFSDKQISQKNKSEVRFFYDVWGYISIKSIDEIILRSQNDIKQINEKYFDNKSVVSLLPTDRYTSGLKKTLEDEGFLDMNANPEPFLSINSDLILDLKKNIIFYYDLRSIHDFFRNEISKLNYYKNNIMNECGAISQTFIYMNFIDYATSQFRFAIDQNQTSRDELEDKEKIFQLFINCFEHKVINFNKVLNLQIANYFNLNEDMFMKGLNKFILENAILFEDEKTIKQFENDILKIYVKLSNNFKQIGKNNLKFNYTKSDVEINEHFQKNINIYVLSSILTFMIALVTFYLLFFLRKQLIFLNKIF
tara:strand:- start:601 stop:1593 length:993 start_codon:yes stop_codon:yes gene_type:complete